MNDSKSVGTQVTGEVNASSGVGVPKISVTNVEASGDGEQGDQWAVVSLTIQ